MRSVSSLCARVTSGGTPSRANPDFFTEASDGIPWVKTKELADAVVLSTEERITEAAVAKSSAKRLPRDTVLMAMYGATVGKLGILGHPMTCNQACCAMIVNPEVGDHRFLFYRLLHDRERLIGLANGAAQQNLSGAVIKGFCFPCPPLAEQRAIAGVLGALDDLIETDLATARFTAQQADAAWDSTFQDAAVDLRVADVASVVLGGTPNRARPDFWGGDIPWLNSGKANEFRVIAPSELITETGYASSSTKMMPSGTTLIAITGATLGQITRSEIAACGNQSLVGVFSEDPAMTDHLFFAVRHQIERLVASATGGAQQHINKGNVEDLLVARPDPEALARWHASASPLLSATADLLKEAQALRQTRDELLPLLMSGEVAVGELAVA